MSSTPPGGPLAELARALVKLMPAGLPGALNPDEAAGYLGMSRSTVDDYAAAGLIPAPRKVGGKVLHCRAELDAWLAHGCPPSDQWAPIWRELRLISTPTH